jgi:hypothetical protein
MTNHAAGTPVPPCYTAGRAFTSSRVPRRNRSTRVDTHSHNLASAVCTPNIAQIRPGSNLTRSFVNASSKCSDAGSVWPAATSSRSDSSSCRSSKRGTKKRD